MAVSQNANVGGELHEEVVKLCCCGRGVVERDGFVGLLLYEMGARATATAAAAGKESIVIGKEGKKRGAEEQTRRGLPGSDQTKGRFW